MEFCCANCGKVYPLDGLEYKCECGGLFNLKKPSQEKVARNVSLGETVTPILDRELDKLHIHLKVDYLMPTGSFKDRGAVVLVNKIKELGITEVVEDSSGNAGASIAGYCAAAGIKCNIYVPESTSAGKIKQITAYGANVVKVPGSRDDTAQAVLAAARNIYYASHVYNPLFFEGTKSIAYEIYEQVGIPDYLFIPTGNGTMLLGAYIGFLELGKLPKLIAVQTENCRPIYNKVHGLESYAAPTIAEGIAVQTPMRIDQIIHAVKESGGEFITVNDEQVKAAQEKLWKMGIYIEPTAGANVAGAINYFATRSSTGLNIVAPLTGTGLKKG